MRQQITAQPSTASMPLLTPPNCVAHQVHLHHLGNLFFWFGTSLTSLVPGYYLG